MTLEKILELSGIPLLVFVVCVYYGIRLIIFQDMNLIRNKNKGYIRDEKGYSIEAGKLILFYGVATLAMAILLLFNVNIAVAEIIICTLVMGFLWKKMNKKYGI